MRDLESYRFESSESKVMKIVLPEETGPGKFLTDILQKERVGVVLGLAAGALFLHLP